ncbi:ROK family glucokinase [Gracilibacillus sp. YIM 98692]|uniref:ROK family glucokinase n=1 Tax=Gracilibacillus sp. YIM 98692 TaxID=2663532 RepID=UPI0013D3E79B|nr:ROK family glucokinase [Gracilibacillus sp. YIM 98692]
MHKDLLIGVDIGGTTVKHAVISVEGNMLEKWEIPTRLDNNGEQVPYDIWESIQKKLKELDIEKNRILGIGVGAPGFIDPETGNVAIAVNIGWKDYHLQNILAELSELNVYVENDANIAALGENWKGSGNQVKNMIAVTLGTGVGGGIISNGQIVNGANGTAGEIGHITVEQNGAACNCGRKGCLETVTSATGIVRQAKQLIEEGKAPQLLEKQSEVGELTTKEIFEVAATHDEAANQVLDYVFNVLGQTLANLAITTNPAKIVIGGGVSKAGSQLLEPVKKAFQSHTLARTNEACEFAIAALGNDAGVYGGAYLVLQHTKQ